MTDKKSSSIQETIVGLVFLFIVGFIIYLSIGSDEPETKAEVELALSDEGLKSKLKAAQRSLSVESQFSGWDGSHYKITSLIKSRMNDPDSYEHDSTTYTDMGDYLRVNTRFRGKNGFGGVVRDMLVAEVDLEGGIMRIVE